ncbi:phosphatase PAP2 family protein [Parabacteroides sp. FAFU027]|uniref:phosphatase PAP2 family protein n=1 Tax=Parabacteroides sp. FAFU027 TaxID=2922715 RepID=UPI001FAFAACF|nr:phosphatase PAP2 family protein [Parabacteroides sp. FAFU027]
MANRLPIRFLAVEKITFAYILFTTILILSVMGRLANPLELVGLRLMIAVTIFILAYFNSLRHWWVVKLARYAFVGALLSFWYPDTYEINRALINHDYLLAGWEQMIFGCQPALLFRQAIPQHWFSELVNMGYFAYYPIILGSSLYFFFFGKKHFEHFFFVVLCSFYIYYIIYILFPTAGPQYYFPAIGLENVHAGIFPEVGRYFNYHSTLNETANNSGIFFKMVEHTQQVGERPTAAFPSSHVGISTLILLLIWRKRRYRLLAAIIPFYICLVMATVYIEAHYLIDVIAGLITAGLFYYLSNVLFVYFNKRYHGLMEHAEFFEKRKPYWKTKSIE